MDWIRIKGINSENTQFIHSQAEMGVIRRPRATICTVGGLRGCVDWMVRGRKIERCRGARGKAARSEGNPEAQRVDHKRRSTLMGRHSNVEGRLRSVHRIGAKNTTQKGKEKKQMATPFQPTTCVFLWFLCASALKKHVLF